MNSRYGGFRDGIRFLLETGSAGKQDETVSDLKTVGGLPQENYKSIAKIKIME